ncbi:MAG TPA: serine/threonine-protein kinase [Kofleriaceae bacterium]|jgi:serine/threonine-protein kinase
MDGSNDDTLAEDADRRTPAPLSLPGYVLGAAIGAGGMGEVLGARDSKIGRDVAIKRMRVATPELRERFLREAKIQARLDHPAIAPVYELGEDASGQPYFTMKRLAGTTLLDRLAAGDPPQRLLRAFVDVCHAIDFAHARGVVHRDLKPANIMLGEFGEVYVLDWGVARVVTQLAITELPTAASPSVQPDAHTLAGALLGTPGYMAPEQARGHEVGLAADVYSLGCILFEILAGEPLHPPGTGALGTTISAPSQSPAARAPDRAVAPELDAACTAALAGDPASRPTARELAQRVDRYLDGDRDQEQRAKLAAELVVRAREVAGNSARRSDAIRDAGRALALDPDSPEAAALVMTLMLEPPKQLPAELRRHLETISTGAAVHSARQVVWLLLATFGLIPLAVWVGVTNWPLLGMIYGLVAILALDAYLQTRRGYVTMSVPLVFGTLLVVMVSRFTGSIAFAPTIAMLFVVGLASHSKLAERPVLVLGCALLAMFAPVALELAGVFSRSWDVAGDSVVLRSQILHLSGTSAYLFLLGGNAFFIVAMFLFARSLTTSGVQARERLEIHAWQLRQLLPVQPPLVAVDCR